MRNKSSTLLTEIILALLFFSLSSIILVQLFATGYEKSLDSKLSSQALYCAQDWAEQATAAKLTPPDFFSANGWTIKEADTLAYLDPQALYLEYTFKLDQGHGGTLYSGSLSVWQNQGDSGNEPLLSLPITQCRREGSL